MMTFRLRLALASLTLSACAPVAPAAIGANYPIAGRCDSNSPAHCTNTTFTERPAELGVYDVVITTDRADVVYVHLYATAGEHFGNITYISTSGAQPQTSLYINGDSSNHLSLTRMAGVVGTIKKADDAFSQRPRLILDQVRVSGDVGSIDVDQAGSDPRAVDVLGNINGTVRAGYNAVSGGASGVVSVFKVGGNVLGAVTAEVAINSMLVSGTIGTPGSPVTTIVGRVATDMSGQFIGTLQCAAFYGTLRGPGTHAAPPTGLVRTTSGPVEGELRISSLFGGNSSNSGLRVAGDVNANVPITFNADAPIVIGGKLAAGKTLTVLNANQGISMGGLDQTARLIVKGSLPTGKSITIGTTSKITMGGQVILNADNASGTWAGTVIVGSTVLSPAPAYPISSALLGTGAVGLVPFQFYRQDCSPPQATTTSSPMVRNSELAGGNYPAIRLRFYGPVALPAGQSAINTIRVFQGVPPTSLEDDEMFNEVDQGPEMTGSWTATLAAVPFNAGRQELRLAYTGGTPAAGPYYITNMGSSAQLLCDLGLTPNPPIAGFTYRFTVQTPPQVAAVRSWTTTATRS